MAKRIRVYVAGPISKGDKKENVQRGIDAGLRLLEAGFAPMIPHLTDLIEPTSVCGTPRYEWWLEHDLAWVEVADCLLRLPGESAGADREVAAAEAAGVPVYYDLAYLFENPPARGDERFHALLRQIGLLHDRKQADYGAKGDPFANVRASRDFGISPWIGACLRANDKVRRIKSFIENGNLKNESVEDSLMDNAVYNLIALILFREERQAVA